MSEHNFEAWCTQHDCRPEDCWLAHNPRAAVIAGADTPEQVRERVKQRHLAIQEGAKNAKQHTDSTQH